MLGIRKAFAWLRRGTVGTHSPLPRYQTRLALEPLEERATPAVAMFSASFASGSFAYQSGVLDPQAASQSLELVNFQFNFGGRHYTADTTPMGQYSFGSLVGGHIEASSTTPGAPHVTIDVVGSTAHILFGTTPITASINISVVDPYLDYRGEVAVANAAFDADHASNLSLYWADVNTARSAAESALAQAESTMSSAIAAAYDVYLSAESSAYDAYLTAVDNAYTAETAAKQLAWEAYQAASDRAGSEDQEPPLTADQEAAFNTYVANWYGAVDQWVSSEVAAYATYLAAEATAWSQFLQGRDSAYNQYLASAATIDATRLSQEQTARDNFDARVQTALGSWNAREANAWNNYLAARVAQGDPTAPGPRAQPPEAPQAPVDGYQLQLVQLQLPAQKKGAVVPRGVIKLSPASGAGAKGTEIEISVERGFKANMPLTVEFNGPNGKIKVPANLTTDANGKATFKITLDQDFPKFGRINPLNGQVEGYEIRVRGGQGADAIFAYGQYPVTK